VVCLLDDRGWFYRYGHLQSFATPVLAGARVRREQALGRLGKEGGSGGWSHLHFDISGRQPSGKWGTIEGYAFLWEAYVRQYRPAVMAVARPHHFALTGENVELDGSRSWSAAGDIAYYEWPCSDGQLATGAMFQRSYSRAGVYSEILKVTDRERRVDHDFAVVHVLDRAAPTELPPSINAIYYPTTGIQPGDPITFGVRTSRTTDGAESWDFGYGSPPVTVRSDGNALPLDPDGYAKTVHH
jgi:murein DD-endopeptidase MepM/ murein hydrolase activator NlpD